MLLDTKRRDPSQLFGEQGKPSVFAGKQRLKQPFLRVRPERDEVEGRGVRGGGVREVLRSAIQQLAVRHHGQRPDAVVAIESRGLIVGSALAYELGIGVVPVRKKG